MIKLEDPYWYDTDWENLPFRDFNRELCPPGTDEMYPDGVVALRMDDDFWVCAALPWEYKDKTAEEIVKELWPELTDCEFKPDSGDPWWQKYFRGEV